MATIALQKIDTDRSNQSRRLGGQVTGKGYTVDQLGRVIVDVLDSYRLISQGWLPIQFGSGAGSSATSGTTLLDFGTFPGASLATTTVVKIDAQDPNAVLEVFVTPAATADHSIDEHIADPPLLNGYADGAGNIVIEGVASGRDLAVPAGTPFGNKANSQMPVGQPVPMPYGKWNVGWAFLP